MTLDDITDAIRAFAAASPMNVARDLGSLRIFDAPLVAAAAADDPLFERLKDGRVVGPMHLSPLEWLPGSRTVVSYFLPFSEAVRKANRGPGLPALEWLYGRIEGENFNKALRSFVVDWFQANGCRALSPALDPRIGIVDRRCNWSERHVAFVAGLGTFSLSRSLITRLGAAGRIGSVIVDADIPATRRAYGDPEEYCIKCGACIVRCPPQAIDEIGKDNAVCSDYLDRVKQRCAPRYGCGKCQTAVPCEAGIPAGRRVGR